MKVVAYSIKPFEKEFLAKANQKRHDITLISNPLSLDTIQFADGKDAVIVFTYDEVSAQIIEQLAARGIKYITTWSAGTDHIDKQAALTHGIKLANVPISPQFTNQNIAYLQHVAEQTIKNLDAWQQNKCVGQACVCAKNCRSTEVHTPLNVIKN